MASNSFISCLGCLGSGGDSPTEANATSSTTNQAASTDFKATVVQEQPSGASAPDGSTPSTHNKAASADSDATVVEAQPSGASAPEDPASLEGAISPSTLLNRPRGDASRGNLNARVALMVGKTDARISCVRALPCTTSNGG
ncbi:hypothetical protein PENSPDRAFT_662998 [Peniophora sp. CONT]|nr:hypothetical protein PENSPDRAFT_662998 [Peniophora sp. CONT]